MKSSLLLVLALAAASTAQAPYTDPNCDGKQVLVHLFEWKWDQVAAECETFLSKKGFCGVQVSPVNEHIRGDQWWTRYQPVSYQLNSRSGSREQFIDMVNRCNAVGVNVIVDLVINHMTGHGATGTGVGGSAFDGPSESYPAVPYSNMDFHQPYCDINNYGNVNEVRNCYLVSLNDLDGGKDYVRTKIAEFVNDLIDIGVKGFRVDAAKHMWPGDLEPMLAKWKDVDGKRPMVFHEVIDQGGEPITTSEYFHLGKVTEFKSCNWLACIRDNGFDCLKGFGNGLSDGMHALTFVDNHDNQRGHGGAGGVLTYKEDYNYKLATGFHLAQDYGFKRVMSSYDFTNTDQGPPGTTPCGNGWICEHRWSSIGNLVQFANVVAGTPLLNWQNKEGSLGFSRGAVGFFAMGDLNNVYFDTGLPDGQYCDLVHDCKQTITVVNGGATFNKAQANDPVVAICVGCTAIPFP